MRKLLTAMVALGLVSSSFCTAMAFTNYNTYDRYGNKTGSVRSIFPGIVTRYDANGNKIGTYTTNRNYNNRYYAPSATFPNRVYNRTYYYNNGYYPSSYRYRNGLGGIKSYNRFGQRIR
ncbi:TPA: hypothetical protein IAA86_08060 [Candidatus Galligastranaerophilus intestinavium]|uniref:Uncharacterized protein n=1 Tax=Candidatus Galligastranaerophilus intestinavium TaxID=2840836 RepID=A0A9D1FJE1_9BACT|nr:hypothetical protein [Candidatus Galligastranaerophilus intestinavium]